MNKKTVWTLMTELFLVAALMLLSACSDAGEGLSKNEEEVTQIQKPQTETAPKTRKIEGSLQDIAERYKELSSPQPTRTGNKIEVLEVFWYGCPHCYQFEPVVEKWLEEKAGYIEFVRIPGVLGKQWLPHARAYYAAEKLGVLEKIHQPLFNAIHNEKRKIFDEKSLKKFFAEHGVDGNDFDKAYQSKEVEESVRTAFSAGKNYELTGVPTVVINGKYTTSASMAGSFDKVIEVINILSAKEYEKLNE